MGNSIYQAITNAMSDISPIAKDKKNAQQGFQYRGIDDVMNELSPILAKNRIFIYPEVIAKERSERQTKSGGALIYSILTVKYHFATDDGSEVCTTVIGEGMDSGDKASNKAMAVAFKYACLQMFCIPTADMDDPDKDTPPALKSTTQQRTPPPQQPAPLPPKDEERTATIGKIADVLKTNDANGKPYFTEAEKSKERAYIIPKTSTEELKIRAGDLRKELEKRQQAFEDDIPWETELKQPDLY